MSNSASPTNVTGFIHGERILCDASRRLLICGFFICELCGDRNVVISRKKTAIVAVVRLLSCTIAVPRGILIWARHPGTGAIDLEAGAQFDPDEHLLKNS